MLRHEDLQPLLDTKTTVYGSDGEKIGTFSQIYRDEGTDLPQFATVKTGLFGSSECFVPLNDAEISNGNLYVRFTKHFVSHAPNIEPVGHLSLDDENRLYEYYSQAGLGADKQTRDAESGHPRTTKHPNTKTNEDSAGVEARSGAALGEEPETPTAEKRTRGVHKAEHTNGTEPMVEDGRQTTEEGPETTERRQTKPMDP